MSTSAPTLLNPLHRSRVTIPLSFSWTPSSDAHASQFLNVSTSIDFEHINIINSDVTGKSYYSSHDISRMRGFSGTMMYWRLVRNGVPSETRSFRVGDISYDPFYLNVHASWPSTSPLWDPADPASIKTSVAAGFINQVGFPNDVPTDSRLGISYNVAYFNKPDISVYVKTIRRLLKVAENGGIPIFIGLDAYQWWAGRPDLWNWWDPGAPGYDPENRYNVEWTSWSPYNAVRDGGTRDWGAPIVMNEPHPNLSSPKVLQATEAALDQLLQPIAAWYKELAPEDKYLLAGIKFGWELGIGINYRYSTQVGYASVSTAGIKTSGPITADDITAALQLYCERITSRAVANGIPRNKSLTHVGAIKNWIAARAALCPGAIPGWTLAETARIDSIPDVKEVFTELGKTQWACSEWGTPNKAKDVTSQIQRFIGYRNCKLVNAFSFGKNIPSAICTGIASSLGDIPGWMHPPVISSSTIGSDVMLSWSVPCMANAVYLNITQDPEVGTDGLFRKVTVSNQDITGGDHLRLSGLAPGRYYWIIVCDSGDRRVSSSIGKFRV